MTWLQKVWNAWLLSRDGLRASVHYVTYSTPKFWLQVGMSSHQQLTADDHAQDSPNPISIDSGARNYTATSNHSPAVELARSGRNQSNSRANITPSTNNERPTPWSQSSRTFTRSCTVVSLLFASWFHLDILKCRDFFELVFRSTGQDRETARNCSCSV